MEKLIKKLNKNREKLDGLYNVDTHLFLFLLLSTKLRLNDLQLKVRLNCIKKEFFDKAKIIEQAFFEFKKLFAEQRFMVYVRIELAEIYENLSKTIENKEFLLEIKFFIDKFIDAIDTNKLFNFMNFQSYLNEMEIKIKIAKKFLKSLTK